MPAVPDKIIVTNLEVLKRKYKAPGVNKVKAAVKRLIAADLKRGIVSVLVDLSDAATMATYGGAPVGAASVGNPQLNKAAIDAIFSAGPVRPAYLMLLGSVDVIPHVPLNNPMAGDGDPDVPSDLPYACDVGYSTRIQDFTSPNRVVGRLPNVTNDKSPTELVALIDTAAKYRPRAAADYMNVLGLSAHVWRKSTELSLDFIFGAHAGMKIAPPDGSKWSATVAKRLTHFVNCHGAAGDPHFYGEKAGAFPEAHSAKWMATRLAEGTIMAAECCYGAELYDPALPTAGGQSGMCNTYLGAKAYAYFGSTNIAYGPPSANDQADLVCQSFLLEVVNGASAGRACLKARLDYVAGKGGVLTPVDLKTLAQFNLMADPSLTPVQATPHGEVIAKGAMTKAVPAAAARHERLVRRAGLMAQAAGAVVFRLLEPTIAKAVAKSGVLAKLRKLAADHGIKEPDVFLSFDLQPPKSESTTAKARSSFAASTGAAPTAVHAIFQRFDGPAKLPHLPLVRGVEALEYPDATVARVFESR